MKKNNKDELPTLFSWEVAAVLKGGAEALSLLPQFNKVVNNRSLLPWASHTSY